LAAYGDIESKDQFWTNGIERTASCNSRHRLYCFDQVITKPVILMAAPTSLPSSLPTSLPTTASHPTVDFSREGVEDGLGYANLNWNVAELDDSRYEVKVQSECRIESNNLFATIPNELKFYDTEIIEVIIDRTPPVIYGTPQIKLQGPFEFVQHFEYSILFTELLYCEIPYVFNLKLILAGSKTFEHGDGIHVMCTGNAITYRFDMNELENFATSISSETIVTVLLELNEVEDVAHNQMVVTDPFESTWDRSTDATITGSLAAWQSLPQGLNMKFWQRAAAVAGLEDVQMDGGRVRHRFLHCTDSHAPIVSINFDRDDDADFFDENTPGSYLHLSSSDNYENIGFSYTIEDNCQQMLQTKIKISSNEFEYNESQSSGNMAVIRETINPRQSHGLKIFVKSTQCQNVAFQSLCEADSNVGFRYYQFDVEATDFVGNVGAARAFVVVVPDDFDRGANQDHKHFINVINDSRTVTIIQTVNSIWDTTQ